MNDPLGRHYLDEVSALFRHQRRLAEKAIAQLSEDQLFTALDDESNSIAIVMQHMGGNLRSRWRDFLTTDGEKPDRHRDAEFELAPGTTWADVEARWNEGWSVLSATLESLTSEDLLRAVTIRAESHTVVQALERGLAHAAYHSGQIVQLARHLRGDGWHSLSIARGESEAYLRRKLEQHGEG
ncbi:MAG: DUF1572 family protein [Thermoanaerobaculia bacterium]